MNSLEKKWNGVEHTAKVDGGKVMLEGNLCIPTGASALVVFVHGSGSSRHSTRNKFVSHMLNNAGLSTLLFDLLTSQEESIDARTARLRFDIELLAGRVVEATRWLRRNAATANLDVGYFGASTGAAAALVAAARLPDRVGAVVSRGGRPDLAGSALPHVIAPTLLIVGAQDPVVLNLNRQTLRLLPPSTEKSMAIVPGATHLFEESGTLEQAAVLACDWFTTHLLASQDLDDK
jgi:pimeloyl-ACP methyl ester carboxylesterase